MLSIYKALAVVAACGLATAACLPFEVPDTPAVYGIALDSTTAAPIRNAQIRIVPTGRPDVAKTVTTDETGRFKVDPISHHAMILVVFPHAPFNGFQDARIEAAANGYHSNAQDLTAARKALSTHGEVQIYLQRQ